MPGSDILFAKKFGGGSGGGGSGLPDVTTADNGKVLLVENGEWMPVSNQFVVTFTKNGSTWSADRTFAEIGDARTKGREILGAVSGSLVTTDSSVRSFTMILPLSGESFFGYVFGGAYQSEANTVFVTILRQPARVMAYTKTVNIGSYSKPSNGIPESDLATAVQSKLLPAVTTDDNGKVLGVVNGAWGVTQPGYTTELFEVSALTDLSQVIRADKTFAEITSAYNAGKNVVVYLDKDTVHLCNCTVTEMTDAAITFLGFTLDHKYIQLDVNSSDIWAISYSVLDGPQGDIGPQGERGEQGEQGPQGERGERGEQGEPGGVIVNLATAYASLAMDLATAFSSWVMAAIQAGGSEVTVSNYTSNTSEFLSNAGSAASLGGAIPSIIFNNTLFVPALFNANEWGCYLKFRYFVENVGLYMLRANLLIMSNAIEISGTATAWTPPTAQGE